MTPQRPPSSEMRASKGLSEQRPELLGPACALGAAALFGLSTPAAKLLLRDVSPVMLAGLLYIGAAAALFGYRAIAGPASRESRIKSHDLPLVAGMIAFGGVLGPILLFLGLKQLSAVTASLLLNLELPFTVLIAIMVMGEHVGCGQLAAITAVVIGSLLVGLGPGEVRGGLIGVLEICGACLCWGIDNNLTQRVSLRDPVSVARLKTLAAGACAVIAALWLENPIPAAMPLSCALVIGALCYGLSIVLVVKALRIIGAAREAAYFATAPFVGAVASALIFRAALTALQVAGAAFMVLGAGVLTRERHSHAHRHDEIFHEHLHYHDEHHQHRHRGAVAESHSHPHRHTAVVHEHRHFPDLHHRHDHREPIG